MTDSISPQEKDHLIKVITEVLTKYDSQVEKQTISDFTNQFIEQRETLKSANGFLNKVNSSFSAIDSINDYHKSLINAQNQGKSKLTWFRATIESITNVKDVQKIEKITQEVQSALIKSNNQHLSSLLNETVQVFVSQNDKKAETTNQQDSSRELLGDIQNNSLLTIISTGQQLDSVTQKLNFTPDKDVLFPTIVEQLLAVTDEDYLARLQKGVVPPIRFYSPINEE
jgi:hypothetical protein